MTTRHFNVLQAIDRLIANGLRLRLNPEGAGPVLLPPDLPGGAGPALTHPSAKQSGVPPQVSPIVVAPSRSS